MRDSPTLRKNKKGQDMIGLMFLRKTQAPQLHNHLLIYKCILCNRSILNFPSCVKGLQHVQNASAKNVKHIIRIANEFQVLLYHVISDSPVTSTTWPHHLFPAVFVESPRCPQRQLGHPAWKTQHVP